MNGCRRLLFALLFMLGCTSTPSQGPHWYVNGEPAPDTHRYKSSGAFGAQLIVTDAPESLYEFWNNNPPGAVPVSRLDSTEANTHIETIVFFVGCLPDSSGKCHIEAEATVTTGSGETLVQGQRLVLSTRPKPPGRQIGISEQGVGLTALSSHKSYQFKLRVIDRLGKESVVLTQHVDVDP